MDTSSPGDLADRVSSLSCAPKFREGFALEGAYLEEIVDREREIYGEKCEAVIADLTPKNNSSIAATHYNLFEAVCQAQVNGLGSSSPLSFCSSPYVNVAYAPDLIFHGMGRYWKPSQAFIINYRHTALCLERLSSASTLRELFEPSFWRDLISGKLIGQEGKLSEGDQWVARMLLSYFLGQFAPSVAQHPVVEDKSPPVAEPKQSYGIGKAFRQVEEALATATSEEEKKQLHGRLSEICRDMASLLAASCSLKQEEGPVCPPISRLSGGRLCVIENDINQIVQKIDQEEALEKKRIDGLGLSAFIWQNVGQTSNLTIKHETFGMMRRGVDVALMCFSSRPGIILHGLCGQDTSLAFEILQIQTHLDLGLSIIVDEMARLFGQENLGSKWKDAPLKHKPVLLESYSDQLGEQARDDLNRYLRIVREHYPYASTASDFTI